MTDSILTLDEALKLAKQVHHQGDARAAETLYRKILEVAPEWADALSLLGILLFQQGDAHEAQKLLRRAILSQPENPGLYNNLANVLRARGDLNGAVRQYAVAAALAPDDVDVQKNHALALQAQQRAKAAIDEFRHLVSHNSETAETYQRAGRLLYLEGRIDEATEVFRGWLDQDPENPIAQHMFAACSGTQIPDRASDQFVQGIFDGFASTFDNVLSKLGYRAPELIAEVLQQHTKAGEKFDDVLDAGCGTGLCGPLLRPISQRLTGVDLSSGMLARAEGRHVYDELFHLELCSHLLEHTHHFDLIVSADTLIYFGDLRLLMRAVAAALREGGLFAFTIECRDSGQSDSFELTPSGRYSHSRSYVETKLVEAGLSTLSVESFVLRKERGNPVAALLFVCKK
jgi:predicted TPR repeat methyltransferase